MHNHLIFEYHMKPSVFLNDMLTKGAILGAVMLASNIAENAMLCYGGTTTWLAVMSLEIIASIALYIFLLRRFTRNYANLVLAERKTIPYFTYGNGLAYIVSVSMLAGVIVALGNYMFVHYIVGFESYITGYVQTLKSAISGTEMPSAMIDTYEQMFKALESQDEPSLISKVLSTVWSYLVGGTFVGIFIAATTRRKADIFNNQNTQDNE